MEDILQASRQNSASAKTSDPLNVILHSTHRVLETYSNVHRGSGYNSMMTTNLYEQAREIVLNYLNLNKRNYTVIFCTPARAEALIRNVKTSDHKIISDKDFGLMLGVRAIAIRKKLLPGGIPFESGGGTTRLYSKDWVIWENAPDKFEAGTPAIVNIIAFAKALLQIKKTGNNFQAGTEKYSVDILYNDELKEFSGGELLIKLRQTLIGKDLLVPTLKGLKSFINLDNSASTRTFELVWKSFAQAVKLNPEAGRELSAEVKSICAEMLGAPLKYYDIIFTSNTTESVNFLAHNLKPGAGTEGVILNSLLDHSSNDLPWRNVPGHTVIKLSINKDGFYDLDELEKILSYYNREKAAGNKRIELVAVSGASNVLGSCNDLMEISRIVHQYGANLFVDAAQLIAHRSVNMEKSGIDFLAFSGHKIYAPFGCGVLAAKKGVINFNPSLLEKMRSSGEENIGGIAALGKALLLLNRIGFDTIVEEERTLTEKAITGMSQIPGMKLYGIIDTALPEFKKKIGVIVFEIKRKSPGSIAKQLASLSGIGVRYGCHCAHMLVKHLLNIPPFMENIQRFVVKLVPTLKLQGLVRVSFGLENSEPDVDALLNGLREITAQRKSYNKSEYKKELKKHIKAASDNIYGEFKI